MSLREQFQADLGKFLANHAVNVKAAGSVAASLQGMDPFKGMKVGSDAVSLAAPSGYAKLEMTKPKVENSVMKCGAPEVLFSLVNDSHAIPVYVIPYKGMSGLGVKLPTGREKAYAITTRIDGCTFSISGSRQTPYASHSNVYDTKASKEEKRDKMGSHIQILEAAFRRAELEAGADGSDVGADRAHFNYWHRPPIPGQAQVVNYAEIAQQRVAIAAENGVQHYRRNQFGSHKKHIVKLSDESASKLLGENFIPYNAVIGERVNGDWTFYYNTSSSVTFEILEQVKIKGLKLRNNRTIFATSVVLCHGTIWPQRKIMTRPFFTAEYEGGLGPAYEMN